MIRRIVQCSLLLLMVVVTTASAQAVRRSATPSGYEEYWRGIAAGGNDSLFHRVYITANMPRTDTVTVELKTGERQSVALVYDHTTVEIELLWFTPWVVVREYPWRDERYTDKGWRAYLMGLSVQHLRFRRRDVAAVWVTHNGIASSIQPTLPR